MSAQSEKPIKVITLHQFYASGMALGLKRNETRPRRIHYRGLLAIHSAKTIPQEKRDAWWSNKLAREAIQVHGYRTIDDLPLGKILCVVKVVDCISTNSEGGVPAEESIERAFGIYTPDRWVWIMEDCQRLAEPISYSGNQTIHDLPLPVLERVKAQFSEESHA